MAKRREMVAKGDNKQRIEYAEIYKTIKKRISRSTPTNHMRNDRDIKVPEESSKNAEARPRQTDHTTR